MYDELINLINEKKWDLAMEWLGSYDKAYVDDTFYILAATVFMEKGYKENAFEVIQSGLKYNYKNYELYYMLGLYYQQSNYNMSWLCYENALFYCDKNNINDIEEIQNCMKKIESNVKLHVKNISIVINACEDIKILEQCIKSIRMHILENTYEIIIVDRYDNQERRGKLLANDIKVIKYEGCNSVAAMYNVGIKSANKDNDILLLSSQAIIMPNSIFLLRLELYKEEKIGAVGSVTNDIWSFQKISEEYTKMEQYIEYAIKNNIPTKRNAEQKNYLEDKYMLLKREAAEEVGEFDEQYAVTSCEDVDFGIRMKLKGWKLHLCYNSFIGMFDIYTDEKNNELAINYNRNAEKFIKKWGMDFRYYISARIDMISFIRHSESEKINVLEIGCGLGSTIARINYLWPNAKTYGIELMDNVVKIASTDLNIIQGNIETMSLEMFKDIKFDYIICGDVIEHLINPEDMINKMIPFLKDDGRFICSIPNIMHISVIANLLKGEFKYTNSGILDRTHMRFFTLSSIIKMFEKFGMSIEKIIAMKSDEGTDDEKNILEYLQNIPGIAPSEQFNAFQYIFSACRIN